MWQPTGDLVFVKVIEQGRDHIVLPDSYDPTKGDIFEVLSVGPGYYDNGVLVKPEVQPGDEVCVAGKLLKLPGDDGVLVARNSDVVAYRREYGE